MDLYYRPTNNEIVDAVLSYPKLAKRIEGKPEDRKKVLKFIDEIHGEYNPTVIKTAKKVIDNTFGRLYEGIQYENIDGLNIQQLAKDKHLVLVPNHQSYVDFIALSYFMYTYFDTPVSVAAGINLDFFPMGHFFRNAGGFFLRRSFSKDILYKTTFEGYIYYLLKYNKVVEFYFEGGRSRSGKLLRPKFGLFGMLLEAHRYLNDGKEMMFLPLSLAHQLVPEVRAHAKELKGEKKVNENFLQLFKLINIVNKKLGTIHITIGKPVVADSMAKDPKLEIQRLAFECFWEVGRNMPVMPTSLLAMIMLDLPKGVVTWEVIMNKAKGIITFCRDFHIPLTESLSDDLLPVTMKRAMDVFLTNKKINCMEEKGRGEVYYSVPETCRTELMYFKNMIIHHFLVPNFIQSAWFNVFKGKITSVEQLVKHLNARRREMRYEFYLPNVRLMLTQAMSIVQQTTGKEVTKLEECLNLSSDDLYKIAVKVGPFANSFTFIYETYYLVCLTTHQLANESFNFERFKDESRKIFDREIERNELIRYLECYTVTALKDALEYMKHVKILDYDEESGVYVVVDMEKLESVRNTFKEYLENKINMGLSFQ